MIIMDGIEHSELIAIIDFIYTDSADVPKEKLDKFMKIGTKLKVKGLEGKSEILNEEINSRDKDQNNTSDEIQNVSKENRKIIENKILTVAHLNSTKDNELEPFLINDKSPA